MWGGMNSALVFFSKQKSAYELRISDWSSDVCSSDLQTRIEPAASALSSGDGAEFGAPLAEPGASGVVKLGRERPRSDAGRIGLGDAEHEADRARPQSRAARGGARNRVRRGDERIGAVIDIEQHALRAFEQDALARRPRIAQHPPGRLCERQYERRDLAQFPERSAEHTSELQ